MGQTKQRHQNPLYSPIYEKFKSRNNTLYQEWSIDFG